MRLSAAQAKTRRRLVGVVFLLVFALLVWLSVALYNKQFTPAANVTLYTDSVGNEMHPGADVMIRGVQVGEVRQISADGTGARLELAIQPDMVSQIPANVTAEMVPTTLFGERYVDLIMPAQPAQARLTAGTVITQDHAADAVELEKVLNNLLPLLQASEPDKLLGHADRARAGPAGPRQGTGPDPGRAQRLPAEVQPAPARAWTTTSGSSPRSPGTSTRPRPTWSRPWSTSPSPARRVAAQRASFSALYTTVTTASDDLQAFLDANSSNIIQLNADSVGSLQILARYSPEFPCVLKDLVNFEPAVDKLLGKGTNQPGLHVQAVVVPPLGPHNIGRYVAGQDTPKYGDNLGPHCYSVPFRGHHAQRRRRPLQPRGHIHSRRHAPQGRAPGGRPAGTHDGGPDRWLPRGERAGQGADRDGAAPLPGPGPRLGQPAHRPAVPRHHGDPE